MTHIFIGSDHAGFDRKNEVKTTLEAMGHTVEDLGTHTAESTDYPIYGKAVGEAVVAKEGSLGVVVCGSGVGISIAANKVPGIRCVLCDSPKTVTQAREHGGINVLALAGKGSDMPDLKEMLTTFLTTTVDNAERHVRRRDMLDAMGS